MIRKILIASLCISLSFKIYSSTPSYIKTDTLPILSDECLHGIEEDWLVKKINVKSGLFRNEKGDILTISNGLISRSFKLSPNCATISLKQLTRQEELIRAVKPEAILDIEGYTIEVGGLTGQPNLAFLYSDWIDQLKARPVSFFLKDIEIGYPKKRFEWKEVRHHAPDTEWPPIGVHLRMEYALNDISVKNMILRTIILKSWNG